MTGVSKNKRPPAQDGFGGLVFTDHFQCGINGGNYMQTARKILIFRISALEDIF
jgi:hypothetical protein